MNNTSTDRIRETRYDGIPSESIHCESIAARGQKHAWKIDEHRHYDLHQFFWITRGGGRIRVDGHTFGFGPSTAIYVPNMTVHGFEFTPSSVGWVVSVADSLPNTLPEGMVMTALPRPTEQAHLTGIYTALNAEYVSDNQDREEALLHHAGLLALRYRRFHSDHFNNDGQKESARRRLMRKFIHRLEDRFSSPDTVKDYAGALSVTTTHLTRVCRETTGKPATKLIQDRTILEAQRALAHSDDQISNIGSRLGFQTPAYFTRVFTQHTGKSPREYRREARIRAKTNPNSRQAI